MVSNRLAALGGKDSFAGGAGADTLKAKDGVPNEAVDGGPGHDTCTVHAADIKTSCP